MTARQDGNISEMHWLGTKKEPAKWVRGRHAETVEIRSGDVFPAASSPAKKVNVLFMKCDTKFFLFINQ